MANKKISELSRLTANNATSNDWLVCVNGTGALLETKRISMGDLLNGYGITDSKMQFGENTLYADPTTGRVAINGLPWNELNPSATTEYALTVHGNTLVDGTILASGKIIAQGNVYIGDAETDKIVFTSDIASNITPDVAALYDIGSDVKYWNNLYTKNITAKNNLLVLNASTLRGTATVSRNFTVNTDVFIDTTNHYGRISSLRIGDNAVDPGSHNLYVEGDITLGGGDLYSPLNYVNLFNESEFITIGASTGTTNINNNLDVDGDLNIDGDDLTVSTSTFNIANATATTINAFGAATDIQIGSSSGTTNINNNLDVDGDVNIDGGDLTTNLSSMTVFNTSATTINAFGAATDIQIGASTGTTNINNNLDVDGDLNIDGGDLTVSTSTFNIANANALTVGAFKSGTAIEIGALTGKTTIRNANTNISGVLTVNQNTILKGDLEVSDGDLTTTATTFNVFNTSATTINAFGAATDIQIGASTGTTNINNNLDVDGDLNIDGGDLTVSTSTFNIANATVATVNAFGAATDIQIGSSSGTTTVRNNAVISKNLTVTGNLTINGTTTTIESTVVAVEDADFVLRKDATTAGSGGIIVTAGSGPGDDRSFLWNHVANSWDLDSNANVKGNLDVDGDLNIDGGDLTVSTSAFNVATTATNITVGATSGSITLRNANTHILGSLTTDLKSTFKANVEFSDRITVTKPALFSSNVTVLGIFTMNEDIRTLANVESSGTFVTQTSDSDEWEEAYNAVELIKNTGTDYKFLIGTPSGYRGAKIDNSKNSGVQVTWHEATGTLEFDHVIETAFITQNMSLGDYWLNNDSTNSANTGFTISSNDTVAIVPIGSGRTVHGIGSIASGATHVTNTALSVWGNEYIGDDLTVDGSFKTNNASFSFLEGTNDIVIGATGGTVTIKANLVVQGNTQQSISTDLIVVAPTISLGGNTAPTVDDNKDRGIEYRWHNGSNPKLGFFGFDDSTGYFTFIPDAAKNSNTGVFTGTTGQINAKLDWSNILNNPSYWTNFTDGTNTATADLTSGDTFTFAVNGGLTVAIDSANDKVTYSHADTSSVATLTSATNTFIAGETYDTYGHVQTRTTGTVDFTVSDNYAFRSFAISPDSGFTWGTANTNTTQTAESSSDTLTLVSGAGVNLYSSTVSGTDAIKIEHKDTSSISNISTVAGKFVSAMGFDTFGHVISATVTDETTYDHLAVNTTGGALLRLHSSRGTTDDVKFANGTNISISRTDDDTITINSSYVNTTYGISTEAGSGAYDKKIRLTGSDSATDDVILAVGAVGSTYGLTIEESGDTITFKHADTSIQENVNNNGNTFVQDLTFDEYGHVTGATSVSVTSYSTNVASTIVARDASGNFSAGTISAALSGNASSATYASTVTLTNDESTAATNYPLFANATTGNLSPRTDSGFTYNPSTGNLAVNGTYSESSDIRYKTDIQKIENAIEKVEQLNGYTFTKNDIRSTGVIAQEVEKVLPEAIVKDENDYLSVKYGNMIGLLIEAIKEQQEEIKELKSVINTLKK